jgi:hypothetical protein
MENPITSPFGIQTSKNLGILSLPVRCCVQTMEKITECTTTRDVMPRLINLQRLRIRVGPKGVRHGEEPSEHLNPVLRGVKVLVKSLFKLVFIQSDFASGSFNGMMP